MSAGPLPTQKRISAHVFNMLKQFVVLFAAMNALLMGTAVQQNIHRALSACIGQHAVTLTMLLF